MADLMHVFTIYRRGQVAQKVHTAESINAPDEVQCEGVEFNDGTVAVRWCTGVPSTSVWDSFDDFMKIHGHPEYETEVVWD